MHQTLRSKLGHYSPKLIKDVYQIFYTRFQEFQADRSFARKVCPTVKKRSEASDHIICIVVDGLRADTVTEDETTYVGGLSGTTAVAPATWTFPSVSSLLTGQYPHQHGAIRQSDAPTKSDDEGMTLPPKIPDDLATLPEYLAGVGYDTYGAFGFQMPFLAASGRFGTHKLYRNGKASEILGDYLKWLDDRQDGTTFAYLHLSDPHEPVLPPKRYARSHNVDLDIPHISQWNYTDTSEGKDARRYRTHRKRLYEAAVEYVDDELKTFFDQISKRLNSEPTVIVTGDHGEAFWEHSSFEAEQFYHPRSEYCVGHGGTPYESVIRVPLCTAGITFDSDPASLIDIAPTILDEVAAWVPDEMAGYSHRRDIPEDRILLAESTYFGYEKKAVTMGDWKLIVSIGDDRRIGFSLPEEIPTKLPEEIQTTLEAELPPWPDGGESQPVSSRVQKRLSDLGYT